MYKELMGCDQRKLDAALGPMDAISSRDPELSMPEYRNKKWAKDL